MSAFARLEASLRAKQKGTATPEQQQPAQQQQRQQQGEPIPPAAHECCGNDCANCVWIVYADEMAAWEESIT
jgi:hypothetical protein